MTRDSRPSTIAIKTRDPAAYTTARLIVVPPTGDEKSHVLGVPHVRIGAGSSNDIVLDDQHASRFHAELRKTDEGWVLRDLGSLNGTRVGDVAVKEGLLHSGATITVGETKIRFLADEGRAEEIAVSPRHSFGDVVGRSSHQSVRREHAVCPLEKLDPRVVFAGYALAFRVGRSPAPFRLCQGWRSPPRSPPISTVPSPSAPAAARHWSAASAT